jgi:hypothetical protein
MGLPQTVRVKLSSEVAESISLTPVVVQELAMRDLIEHILGVAGKDEARIREILLRGTLVSGASRFRWQGWQTGQSDLAEILAGFPDADPSLPFTASRCTRAILRGGRQAIELAREAVGRKSLFRRSTYWDLLMEVVGASAPLYHGYSYKDRADRFVREFTRSEADRLRAGSDGIGFSTLRDQVKSAGFLRAELYVGR